MNAQKLQRNTHGATTEYKVFYLYVLGVFTLFATFLFAIDFVPELTLRAEQEPEISLLAPSSVGEDMTPTETMENSIKQDDVKNSGNASPATETKTSTAGAYSTTAKVPVRVVAEKVGIDTQVLAPSGTDISTLDTALLKGAVYYPGSGALGENANILIFGHSSHLPIVYNKAYQAFNELGELNVGDTVKLYSATDVYTYSVTEVFLSDAGDAQVSFDASEPLLTLVTCNNFGAKEERWVVIATLVSKHSL